MRILESLPLVALLASSLLPSHAIAQEGGQIDFVTQIQPILKDRCVKCHGAKKQEGDLRLDLKKHVFAGEEDFWSVIPGDPDFSPVYERISLDADDPDIMPEDGDKLPEEQIALIRTWIEQGATWPDSADEAVMAAEQRRMEREIIALPEIGDQQLAAITRALEAVRANGALAMRVAANTQAVEANFSLLGKKVGDAQLDALAGLEPALVWLDLARSGVTDAGLAKLGDFSHLRRLDLSNTDIGDAGLKHLAGMQELEYLNLYGTKVTDQGLAALHGMDRLGKLYLWQTEVTDAGAAKLAEKLAGLHIDRGQDAEAMLRGDAPEAVADGTAPINTECPVSGKPIDPNAFSVLADGKRVAFCCNNCKAKFDADPAKFAAKLGIETAAAPVNDKCPVSGKPVDASVTSELDGKLVAFCCNNCKAKFDADPAKFAAKLGIETAAAPVNDKCPVSGKPVDASVTSELDGKLVAFCCNNCKAKFDADPAKFAAKLGIETAAAPVNDKCPVSGKPVDASVTSELDGKLVAFCCNNCKAKFDADPAKFAAKLGIETAAAPVNDKCPVSGKPVDASVTSELDGKLVAFCCNNCKAKFDADPAKFAAKLGIETAAAPVNDKCPVSGKPVDASVTSELDGKLVAFCCNNCKAKFDADPAKFAAKLGGS